MYVDVDPIKCENNALCVGLAPAVFDLGDDEVLRVVGQPGDDEWDGVAAAVYTCPRQAITARK